MGKDTKKKTAVEWLIEQLPLIQQEGLRDIWGQAKQMEREQIEEAWSEGFNADFWDKKNTSKNYYEQTYGKAPH